MEIDIFQLPGIIRRRLHYIVLSVIACVVLAAFYLSTVVPLYRASTEILLDPQGLLADRRDLFVTGTSPQEQSSLESQTYIVQSRDVLNEVITSLSLADDPYFAKAAKLPAGASEEVKLAGISAALLKHLVVLRAGQSFVLSITAEHPDATRAALIANTVARTYLRKIADTRSDANRRASESFQAQASELRDRVLKAELAVDEFKEQNGLVTTGEKGLLIDQQVVGINEQLTQARLAEEQQKAKYDQTRNLTLAAIEAGAIPEVAQSQSIELLRSRYTTLLEREAELAAGLGSNHPQMRAVRSQLAGVRQSIDAEIGRLRESMRANYERAAANTKSINEQLSKLTRSSYDSSTALTRMRQLESEAEAVRTIYKTFLTRAEELGQTQSVNTNNSHVISEASPPAEAPSGLKKIVLIAAALFGIALGSGLAVLRELFGGIFTRKPSDVAERAGIPIIATLPVEPEASEGLLSGLTARFSRNPKRKTGSDFRRKRELGMLRSVHFLLNTFGNRRPATILFVSPDTAPLQQDIVAEIAETMADLRQSVALAPGQILTPASSGSINRSSTQRPMRGMLATRLEPEEADENLLMDDRLVYRRIPDIDLGRMAPPADFVLIDACGTEAVDYLPLLVEECDAIVIVTDLTAVKRKQIEELFSQLDAWKDKIPGQIVIGGDA